MSHTNVAQKSLDDKLLSMSKKGSEKINYLQIMKDDENFTLHRDNISRVTESVYNQSSEQSENIGK